MFKFSSLLLVHEICHEIDSGRLCSFLNSICHWRNFVKNSIRGILHRSFNVIHTLNYLLDDIYNSYLVILTSFVFYITDYDYQSELYAFASSLVWLAKWVELSWIELCCVVLCWDELNWDGMGWVGLGWVGLNWITGRCVTYTLPFRRTALRPQQNSPNEGLEPSTIRLRAWRSTDWASPASVNDIIVG